MAVRIWLAAVQIYTINICDAILRTIAIDWKATAKLFGLAVYMISEIEEELRDLIGDDGFMRLVETNGGINTYIPKSIAGTAIEKDIGPEHAAKLAEEYGGEHIAIPVALGFRINYFLKQGDKSKRWIALHLKCGERTVYKHSQALKRA